MAGKELAPYVSYDQVGGDIPLVLTGVKAHSGEKRFVEHLMSEQVQHDFMNGVLQLVAPIMYPGAENKIDLSESGLRRLTRGLRRFWEQGHCLA